MKLIDLRSDTVTKPSDAMRKAIYEAEVGDDIYREDKTMRELEEYSASITGKESAIFVPSGTMGNLIPILIWANRGTEVIMHEQAHTQILELSGISAFAGAKPVIIANDRGILTASALRSKINTGASYTAEKTSLIIFENTHNYCGGTCWTDEEMADLAKVAKEFNLPVHMDGARLFNAHVATGLAIDKMSSYANSLTFCLSKGLGAPVGAMICGSKDFINQALSHRKRIGGAMRQSGILAAAGLYALKNNVNRLADDHANAKKIATAVSGSSWGSIDREPETNIVFANTKEVASEVAKKLKEKGVLVFATHPNKVRFVTNLDISDEDTNKVCEIIKSL